jgi:hypothetical protein
MRFEASFVIHMKTCIFKGSDLMIFNRILTIKLQKNECTINDVYNLYFSKYFVEFIEKKYCKVVKIIVVNNPAFLSNTCVILYIYF